MYRTQKRNEETILVRNELESDPVRGSGGIALIDVYSETGIKAVVLPDTETYIQDDKGFYIRDTAYALVRKEEMDKVDMIPGKTKITWDGNTYRVVGKIDARTKYKFQNAEIRMVRHVGLEGTGTW